MDAVLFDFNGVLVDDEPLHLAAFNAVLAPLGVAMSEAVYAERYLGFDDRGAFVAVLGDHGRAAPAELVATLIAAKAQVYAARAATELRVFEGAAELLTRAAARGPVAVVSGALRAEIELGLARLAARRAVTVVVAAEDVAACKPDPAGYLRALELLAAAGLPARAAHCVAIEDSVAGVESARAAGVAVVAVAHTYPAAVLARAGAVATLAHVREVDLDAVAALVAAARGGSSRA